jgi:hypothetical protein
MTLEKIQFDIKTFHSLNPRSLYLIRIKTESEFYYLKTIKK